MLNGKPDKSWRYLICLCPHCWELVAFLVAITDGNILRDGGSIRDQSVPGDRFAIIDTIPAPRSPDVPDHLPAPVASKMFEAERSLLSAHYAAATTLYRTAMERALKDMFPYDKGTLHARIRKAEAEKRFPQAMIDWLDEVRAFGNDAAHEYDWDPTREDAEAARDFASLFLTYAYTMPERVRLARERRTAAKAG